MTSGSRAVDAAFVASYSIACCCVRLGGPGMAAGIGGMPGGCMPGWMPGGSTTGGMPGPKPGRLMPGLMARAPATPGGMLIIEFAPEIGGGGTLPTPIRGGTVWKDGVGPLALDSGTMALLFPPAPGKGGADPCLLSSSSI